MGSSGTGKSTLLNVLSSREFRKPGVNIKGDLMINDTIPLTPEIFGKVGAYVTQNDILFRHFTPREAITFAARLKMKGTKA